MRDFCILFITKNNYKLYDKIFFKKSKTSFKDIMIFNIDCGSWETERKNGLNICKKYNIIDLEVENKISLPSQVAIKIVDEYLNEKKINNIKWVMVCQHDTYFTNKDDFDIMEKFINKKDFINFVGTLGFAAEGLHSNISYGRGHLIDGMIDRNGVLVNPNKEYLERDYFLVEVCYWESIVVNRNLFSKYIIPDYNFILNFWADDIAHQFLFKNKVNVTIPSIIIHDDHEYKQQLGIPSSNNAYNFDYHGDHWNHHHFWNKKRKYPMFYEDENIEMRKIRRKQTIVECMEIYKGTLIEEMFHWHIDDGPKQLNDVEYYLDKE